MRRENVKEEREWMGYVIFVASSALRSVALLKPQLQVVLNRCLSYEFGTHLPAHTIIP